jgi:hypothetical protein
VEHHRYAEFFEALAEPLAVGVQPLATGQFVTDRDHFRPHPNVAPTSSGFRVQ